MSVAQLTNKPELRVIPLPDIWVAVDEVSFSKPTVGASARTLYYGLYPLDDESSDWPSQEGLQAYVDSVLARVKRDMGRRT